MRAAIEQLRRGRPIVVRDGSGADLAVAGQLATAALVNFMAKEARGLVRVALPAARCEELELTQMPVRNPSPLADAFTVSIEAADGVTTGISAADRAHTIRTVAAPGARSEHLHRPGHVFPVRVAAGGVLTHAGRAEAALDLTGAAGLAPAVALCEILADDGTLATDGELDRFCARHGLASVTVAEVVVECGMAAGDMSLLARAG